MNFLTRFFAIVPIRLLVQVGVAAVSGGVAVWLVTVMVALPAPTPVLMGAKIDALKWTIFLQQALVAAGVLSITMMQLKAKGPGGVEVEIGGDDPPSVTVTTETKVETKPEQVLT